MSTIVKNYIYNSNVKENNDNDVEELKKQNEELKSNIITALRSTGEEVNKYRSNLFSKIQETEELKKELTKCYQDHINLKNEEYDRLKLELESKYAELENKKEEDFNNFKEEIKNDIKDMALILFKKFFYKEYENSENLKGLINEAVSQLDDDEKVKVYLKKSLYDELNDNTYVDSNLEIKKLESRMDNLIAEFSSTRGHIEIDIEKQFKKIEDILKTF